MALRHEKHHLRIAKALTISLLIQMFGGIAYVMFPGLTLAAEVNRIQPSVSILALTGAAALFYFLRNYRKCGIGYDSFAGALLIFAILLRLTSAIDGIAYGDRSELVYPSVPWPKDPTTLFLRADTMSVVGTLILAISWYLAAGNESRQYSIIRLAKNLSPKEVAIEYVIGIALFSINRLIPGALGPLSLLANLSEFSALVGIYSYASKKLKLSSSLLASIALEAPFIVIALKSGTKEDLFFPMIPTAILLWQGTRRTITRVAIAMAAMITLVMSQAYITFVRNSYWSLVNVQPSVTTIISDFSNSGVLASLADPTFLYELSGQVSKRLTGTLTRALTVTLADSSGFVPGEVFSPIITNIVPRIVWPAKPILEPGGQHTKRLLGLSEEDSGVRSATAAGFFSELYLGGGLLGLFMGSAILGLANGALQRHIGRRFPTRSLCIFLFVILYGTIRFEETSVLYAFSSLVPLYLYLVLDSYVLGPLERTKSTC